MKEGKSHESHEKIERLLIWGVFILLGSCILAEVFGGSNVDLGSIVNALVIVLTGIAGHVTGKNAAKSDEKISEVVRS